MDFKGKRVLLLEGYARQCLPFLRSLRRQGCDVTLLCNSKSDIGYWSRLPAHKILGVCDPERPEESADYICRLIKTGDYDLVVPLVDFSAKILSDNKADLAQYAWIASNDKDVFRGAQDKLSVMKICQENGIPCPKTLFDCKTIDDILGQGLDFPIVVKPRTGYGARGFHCFNSIEELSAFDDLDNLNNYVVQEYIPQTDSNLSVCLFIDNEGVVQAKFTYCSRRWYPIKGGTGTLNELVERPDAEKICARLASLLGLRGIVGFDLIEDARDGKAKMLEVNPRILACAKIGFVAGIDQAKMILEQAFSDNVQPQAIVKKGFYIRMTQIDFIWFIKSPNRWKAKPSWFNVIKTHDQTFSWTDPLPWFAFLFQGLKRYKKEMKKRS